jgi:hypothetical protein
VSAADDYRYDPADGPRDRSLRVGDKERDAVSEILRQRHLEGRLDSEEFEARLERCLTAKTYAELDELIADFPGARRARRGRAALEAAAVAARLPVPGSRTDRHDRARWPRSVACHPPILPFRRPAAYLARLGRRVRARPVGLRPAAHHAYLT